tara:strand:- start:142 stop:1035 length:894 start_codon:yes stop_codon:yes gene_type:complete
MTQNEIKNEIKYFINKIIRKDKSNWSLCNFKSKPEDLIFSKKKNKLKLKNINIFKPPNDEFWADPFLFEHKRNKYIFFEKFLKKKNKGIISVCCLKNNKLKYMKDILKKNFHQSYPFVFKHNNNIYLIPESFQTKKMHIYKSINFPTKWKLIKSHFKNEIVCDPTFIKHKSSIWLFINKTNENLNDLNKQLFLYKMSNDLSKITPHKKNPIKISSYGGRSAGPIIKFKKKIIRPGQIQQKNNYGFGLVFFEIKKLNLNEYKEKKISSITPKLFGKNRGIHHISHIKNDFVVDLNLTD